MRYLKSLVALLVIVLLTPFAHAQPTEYTFYLPSVFVKKFWMIDPEVIALQAEDIVFSEITAQYHISNQEAIERSDDPEATRAAFEAQGRVNAFFRHFEVNGSPQFLEQQVILYTNDTGAYQGVQGLLAGREKRPINTDPTMMRGVDEIYYFQDYRNGMYIHSAVFRINNYVQIMEAGFIGLTRANTSIFTHIIGFAVERQYFLTEGCSC